MKKDWKTVRLGDVCEIITGNTPSTKNEQYYSSKDIPFIKPSDLPANFFLEIKTSEFFISESARPISRIIPKNSVLVSCIGIIGKVGISKREVSFNQQINALIPNINQIDYKYLASAILNKKKYISEKANAAVVPIINKTEFSNLEILLPPLETQKQIAAVLDKCISLISKYKKILEKYDTLIKSRFIEMFGDPVQNPMGWEVKKLGEICTKISDGVHAKPEYKPTGKPFISVININSGKLLFDDCKYVSEEAYEKMIKSTHPEKGDVLYTKVGATYGIPALVDTDRDFCLYVSVALLKPKSEVVNSQFLTTSMAQPYIKTQADKRIKGIGVPDLHLNQIREFDILLPPLELQNQFNFFVQQIDKSKFAIQKSLEKAETLYKSLMQEYFG